MAEYWSDKLQSAVYSKYITSIPEERVIEAVEFLKEKFTSNLKFAVDIGCGPGPSTRLLAPHFEKVLGIDLSDTQLEEAKKHPLNPSNVEYLKCPAEKLPLEDNSVQLVAVCTALHWFDLDPFVAEVKRILVPNGVLLIWIQISHELLLSIVEPRKPEELNFTLYQIFEEATSPYIENGFFERFLKFYEALDLSHAFEQFLKSKHSYQIRTDMRTHLGTFQRWPHFVKMRDENPELAQETLKRMSDRAVEEMGTLDAEVITEMDGLLFLCRGS